MRWRALENHAEFKKMIDNMLEKTCGPPTDEERAWARAMIAPTHAQRRVNTQGRGGVAAAIRGMVIGMATSKITITLPDEQIKEIRKLVRSGKSANVSAFVKRAVHMALQDAQAFRAMLDEALEQTGGPLTDKERAWVDSIAGPQRHTERRRRRKAA
jgi:Arc/MetJ-type ribon-helix-helix transcriptional regulator